MSTPPTTAHRNLHQRIEQLLANVDSPAPWQLDMIQRALSDLEFRRYPDGTMSRAERPDFYEPATYRGEGGGFIGSEVWTWSKKSHEATTELEAQLPPLLEQQKAMAQQITGKLTAGPLHRLASVRRADAAVLRRSH